MYFLIWKDAHEGLVPKDTIQQGSVPMSASLDNF